MTAVTPLGARRAIRRGVHLDCELVSAHHDEPLRYLATDLSPAGVFLQTPEPVRAGSEVVVCFRPDGWERELMIFAEVVRVSSSRRRVAAPGVGMGLEFVDLRGGERARLEAWLRSRREPVPRRRRPLRTAPAVDVTPSAVDVTPSAAVPSTPLVRAPRAVPLLPTAACWR